MDIDVHLEHDLKQTLTNEVFFFVKTSVSLSAQELNDDATIEVVSFASGKSDIFFAPKRAIKKKIRFAGLICDET